MLIEQVDFNRLDANRRLVPAQKSELGQFMTPPATARLMATLLQAQSHEIKLLDAGAGVGSLTAAVISELCARPKKPASIVATSYEIDPFMTDYLADSLEQSAQMCKAQGVGFCGRLIEHDFIDEGVRLLRNEFYSPVERFNCAILNPPYKKISSDSGTRKMLREVGIETSNLYSAFLAVAVLLLEEGGEIVAITPRSFCNGPYFKPFRRFLLERLSIKHIHVFESRDVAFKQDEVLQENIILHGVKGAAKTSVRVSSSFGPDDEDLSVREAEHGKIVNPRDPDCVIHVVPDGLGASVADKMAYLDATLEDIGLRVSTGRVVEFRAVELLKKEADATSAPLIHPWHFDSGFVLWPKPGGKKPEHVAIQDGAEDLLVETGNYVLVKRFSAKEEPRRIVSAVYDSARVCAERIGFENHINYFHENGTGLPLTLAKGLSLFLNSTLVDMYFRQFNGHTQVNASDLRSLRYPRRSQLEMLGSVVEDFMPGQEELDRITEEVLQLGVKDSTIEPVQAKQKIDQALSILKSLGLPREQQNERSALTLLALLGMKPQMLWKQAADPLMGITPMMDFFFAHYGKKYAPNTRETVRRQTIHQFLEAGLVVANPDKPDRPTNSPYAVYQIETGLLKLLRMHGKREWTKALAAYLASLKTLTQKYAQERNARRIPIQVGQGKTITLSPGGQNVLVEKVVKDFCEIFVGNGRPVYIGDTDEKWAYFDEELLTTIGVQIESHGKMPDVVILDPEKNWLILIEAVTSHGPVNPKRRTELQKLFKGASAGLVFVTAFLDRRTMVKYLDEISWETEV